ncbi:sterol 3-beta-glucosyltransferase UGT80B1-like [Nymphaea colorata]|nr:sterol 3-beta-glucosyltransferase UGT80B1-like [Nymphaea colorata]
MEFDGDSAEENGDGVAALRKETKENCDGCSAIGAEFAPDREFARQNGVEGDPSFVSSSEVEKLAGIGSWLPSLENCRIARLSFNAYKKLPYGGHSFSICRSKSEIEESRNFELRLDKLLETEKNKIIELVKVQKDGTVEVDVTKNEPMASELLEFDAADTQHIGVGEGAIEFHKSIPRLKIAMLVVGTRGDVQPFIAIARRLQDFGHKVRLATHANFKAFVESADIDFYPLGGDARVLAGYMARNKGFLPSGPADIALQRKQIRAIIDSLFPACTEPDPDSGSPFRAQAIIANPPAYGHVHVAEALGVPIHIIFTMPWTPTQEFPHPLARVHQTAGYRLSYLVVDLLIWWFIRDIVNDFRRRMKLSPIAYFSTYHGSISHLPTSYIWSPHLVPKPNDWGSQVDVSGFCFMNHSLNYQPQKEFLEWILSGAKPIYIGFGSMPLEDAERTTSIILEALNCTGQRGIIDRGWGGLGKFPEISDNVFILEECPHDWLFPQCFAVVHHGGAGTTATGLKAGCPTTVIPFFGDQFFWGDRVHEKGVGPAPIPISELSVERLSNAINFMLDPEVKIRALELAKAIGSEDGVAEAVNSFHRHLPPELPLPAIASEETGNPVQSIILTMEKWWYLPCIS